tara:strand:+ start:5272 stop:6405 length:1134 start_codon:yes stop_codon:yes gene_type:complete
MKAKKYNIPVNEPLIIGNAKKYVLDCLNTGWVSSEGEYVSKFENKFANYIGKKYGVSVVNGTAAIELSIETLNLKKGDEVIIPAFTIISCILPLIKKKITPVLVDSKLDDWNMDVTQIEEKITKKTKAIMVVHTYGLSCDMDFIMYLAKKYNLHIIEDAAESHGVKYKNKYCGSFGHLSIFSFYANKLITTGEGGIILTDNKKYYEKLKLLRNLGFNNKKRFKHDLLGWNYRFTNIQSALGLSQLENINKFIKIKKNIGSRYTKLLSDVPGIQLPMLNNEYSNNLYWVYGILIKTKKNIIMEIVKQLNSMGIGTRPFFYPMHKQPILKKLGYFKYDKHPNAEYMSSRGFYLPSGLGMKIEDINIVTKELKNILCNYK